LAALGALGAPLACAEPRLHPHIAPPTPAAEAEPAEATDGPADASDGAADEAVSEPEDLSRQSATTWLEHAFNLWQAEHYAASVAAMREALATQDLNDAGQAMAYWQIYLAEQAQGHTMAAHGALADFIAVAHEVMAWAEHEGQGDPEATAFVQRFDLAGRLARARATLNLAWAKQTKGAGRSPKHPVLVFNDAEMEHFLQLVPPCAQATDRRVVAHERRRDPLGRATAKVVLRCRHLHDDAAYFFAFIGPSQGPPGEQAQAAGTALTEDDAL
jgi:hypothetical protein